MLVTIKSNDQHRKPIMSLEMLSPKSQGLVSEGKKKKKLVIIKFVLGYCRSQKGGLCLCEKKVNSAEEL